MPTRKITQVRKRDGRVVPYDERRIADAIHRAALSTGQDNRYLADDLAGVVTMYLERYYDRDLPESSEIRKMVEKILFETGHAEVAKAYLLYRENRGRVAEPAAPASAGDLFPENLLLVDGLTRDEVSAWGRDRITSALVKEAGLEPPAASDVAAAVEQRIFRLGQRRVSTTLIRDLVNHELLQRGYASKVPKQIVVGLPKYDLARLLEPGTPDPDALVRTVGETTLKQYALQEVFSREVADAHLEGRLHLHHLEQPLKLAWLALSPEDLPAIPALPADCARTLTARIASAHDGVDRRSVGVEVPALNGWYGSLTQGAGPEEAMHLLLALRGWIPGLDLSRSGRFCLDLLRAMRERGHRGERMIVVDDDGRDALREACRQAVEGAPTLFVFPRDGEPRGSRYGREPALAHLVTLNLPQGFHRNETDFYSELERSLELAVRAHQEKHRLLLRTAGLPEGALHGIALSGLDDLVRFMGGRPISEEDGALKLALRIVSYLFFRVREEAAKHRLPMALVDAPAPAAGERFLRIDAQMYPRARGLGIERYVEGFHLREGDAAVRIAVESRFHTLVPSGRVCLPVDGTSAADLEALLDRTRHGTLAAQVQTV